MRQRVILWSFIFCITSVSAGSIDVDLRGKILAETGDSLPGTWMFIKNHPEIACSTDASGAFQLPTNTSVVFNNNHSKPQRQNFRIRPAGKRSGLLVSTDFAETMTMIDIFKADGRRIISVPIDNSGRAEHFVPFLGASWGVYLIKVSTDKGAKVLQMLPYQGMSSFTVAHVSQLPQQGALGKRATSFIDTLVLVRYDYRTTLVGLESYKKTDFVISMPASNTWNNCYCAGMPRTGTTVKILASNQKNQAYCDFEMGQFCDSIWGKVNGRPTSDLEQPLHTVFLSHDFLFDTIEMSQGEYDSVMRNSYPGYQTPALWNTIYGKGSKYPAYGVSWDDAALFCNARSKRDNFDTAYAYSGIVGTPGSQCKLVNVSFTLFGKGYRLPTEAEWEYVASAGKRFDFWWLSNWQDYKGLDSIDGITGYAIWAQNSWKLGPGNPCYGTKPVDSSESEHNWYGVKGMSGNVSEWCNDRFAPYGWGSVIDPIGNPDWTSENLQPHVIRGGNWGSSIFYLRSANRYFNPPGDNKDIFIGFRTIRPL
jgi:formylglycine-generating enzyme required for sulfatase activity